MEEIKNTAGVVETPAENAVEEEKTPAENVNTDVQEPTKEVKEEPKETQENKETEPTNTVEIKKIELTPEEIQAVDSPEKAAEVLKKGDFDYLELQKEFNEKGDLTKETREKLAEAGITGEMVDNFIAGQKARLQQQINEVAESVGGMQNLGAIYQWASKNIDPVEFEAINKINDVNVLKIVMRDLKRNMEEKEGILPRYTRGEGTKVSTDNLYESRHQVMEDMKNPLYQKDESFRAKVAQKLRASVEAGVIEV